MNNFKEQEKSKQHIIFYLTGQNVLTIETCDQIFSNMENENDKIEMLKKFGEANKRYITNENFYKK